MIKVFINFNDAFSFLKEINDGKKKKKRKSKWEESNY